MRRWIVGDNRGVEIQGIRWLLNGLAPGKPASSLVIYMRSAEENRETEDRQRVHPNNILQLEASFGEDSETRGEYENRRGSPWRGRKKTYSFITILHGQPDHHGQPDQMAIWWFECNLQPNRLRFSEYFVYI